MTLKELEARVAVIEEILSTHFPKQVLDVTGKRIAACADENPAEYPPETPRICKVDEKPSEVISIPRKVAEEFIGQFGGWVKCATEESPMIRIVNAIKQSLEAK